MNACRTELCVRWKLIASVDWPPIGRRSLARVVSGLVEPAVPCAFLDFRQAGGYKGSATATSRLPPYLHEFLICRSYFNCEKGKSDIVIGNNQYATFGTQFRDAFQTSATHKIPGLQKHSIFLVLDTRLPRSKITKRFNQAYKNRNNSCNERGFVNHFPKPRPFWIYYTRRYRQSDEYVRHAS